MGGKPVETKPWYKSTTIIGNIVGVLLIVAQFLSWIVGFIQDPEVLAFITSLSGLLIALVNILNRFRTSQPVQTIR